MVFIQIKWSNFVNKLRTLERFMEIDYEEKFYILYIIFLPFLNFYLSQVCSLIEMKLSKIARNKDIHKLLSTDYKIIQNNTK